MPIQSSILLDTLSAYGITQFTGVPDSFFKRLIEILEESPSHTYIPATREDVAVGIAAGAHMAGSRCAVLMENSGLGTSLDALTSLLSVYEIPVVLIIAWAGYKEADEPHHNVMGRSMVRILRAIGVRYAVLPKNPAHIQRRLDSLGLSKKLAGMPVAVLVPPGTLS